MPDGVIRERHAPDALGGPVILVLADYVGRVPP